MERPYFRYKSEELRKLYDNSRNNRKVLEGIRDELKHRHKPKAVALRKQVEDCLNSLVGPDKTTASSYDRNSIARQKADTTVILPQTTEQLTHIASYDDPAEETGQAFSHDFRLVEPIGKTFGHPPKRVFPLKDDVTLALPPGTPMNKRYATALRLLIEEMKRKGAGLRTIQLENGRAVTVESRQKAYQFEQDDTIDLFEGAAVVAQIGTTKSSGFIVAVMQGSLIVSLEDDFGDQIFACVLSVDNTAMLEALSKRLENLYEGGAAGFNEILAKGVVTNDSSTVDRTSITGAEVRAQLNERQRAAVKMALENDVSYIWGPPGTGKTRSLTELTRILFEREKRILICSNTNQAVDQVLLQLCETMGSSHPAVENGAIIRMGRIANEQLDQQWSSYVTVAGIVDRKSRELLEHLDELEAQVSPIREMVARIDKLLAVFDQLDSARQEEKALATRNEAVQEKLRTVYRTLQALGDRLERLQIELAKLKGAGLFRRALMRSEKAILRDHQEITEQKTRTEAQAETDKREAAEVKKQGQRVRDRMTELLKRIPAAAGSRKELETSRAQLEHKLQPLLGKIAEIKGKLADMEAAVVREARIVGATVTKTYVSPKQFSGFHTVIVDEASMVMLPALYYAAGLASERVVISGDFRQLQPIVQTDQRALDEAIGRDVFKTTGITDSIQNGDSPPRLLMLDTQYRMQETICDLISSTMYQGRLKTQRNDVLFGSRPPRSWDHTLTVVDTSRIWPFVNRDAFGSR